jgi:hypothetical protein
MYASSRNAAIVKPLPSGPNGPYRGKAVCDGLKLHDLLEEDPAFKGLKLFGSVNLRTRLRHLGLAQTLKIRQERSKPIMLAFEQWVDELAPAVPQKRVG